MVVLCHGVYSHRLGSVTDGFLLSLYGLDGLACFRSTFRGCHRAWPALPDQVRI